MTIKRLDHVSVVVEDLPAAVAFFTALGMTVAGEMPIEGTWVDRVNAIEGIRLDIVMMKTPDGHGQLELTKFHHPALVELEPKIARIARALRAFGTIKIHTLSDPQRGAPYGSGAELRSGEEQNQRRANE